MNCAPFCAALGQQHAVVREDADRESRADDAQPQISVEPYSGLNSENREPSTMRAITSR